MDIGLNMIGLMHDSYFIQMHAWKQNTQAFVFWQVPLCNAMGHSMQFQLQWYPEGQLQLIDVIDDNVVKTSFVSDIYKPWLNPKN